MKAPQYGWYIRYSALAKSQGASFLTRIFSSGKPDLSAAKANPKIMLAILTNENTFSSATMLGVWVQDGKLGTIIGQPSCNSPSAYGDVLQFQLTNSCLRCLISYKRWLRPDTKADPKTLQPDVTVPIDGDILQAALNYLNK